MELHKSEGCRRQKWWLTILGRSGNHIKSRISRIYYVRKLRIIFFYCKIDPESMPSPSGMVRTLWNLSKVKPQTTSIWKLNFASIRGLLGSWVSLGCPHSSQSSHGILSSMAPPASPGNGLRSNNFGDSLFGVWLSQSGPRSVTLLKKIKAFWHAPNP